MKETKSTPITVSPQEGQSISIAGGNYRILVSGKETGGEFATIDMLIPPGGGPGPHSHAGFHETFYVVDGEVEVKSEAGSYMAKKGAYVVIPKGGIVHNFKNRSGSIAHLLCTVVPAGLEEMFLAMGKPVATGTFIPAPPMDEEGLKKLNELAAQYGQKLYPPDFLG
jgi:quercetin dioxygenase-like cupin family protein